MTGKELLNTDTEVWLSGYCLVNGNFTTMLSRISKKTNKYELIRGKKLTISSLKSRIRKNNQIPMLINKED